ncbi:P-type conjugative transfer protein TrbG [Asticcacaulis sp. SL142]|uniref:P-type conjugative transfer protein TrbG n=1 Tax=Asticcacaulis sp. SL142 TaxID=2995155 RepID=UPI00226D0047|nr:P-type conjugative transfer protein TrbG [Asticcacaulis sp. SL142]WAC48214.1 P-type conjugative transfer protein TrbG [Asticcacaulis sp. SL142]
MKTRYSLGAAMSCLTLLMVTAADAKPVRPIKRVQAPLATESSARVILNANASAVQNPQANSFMNAVQVYTYTEGAIYRLFTAPDKVSDIVLQAGEELISVSAGDTARWVIGDTVSGEGEAKQVHILAKPFSAGLKTNLIITTSRRTYHLQLESTVSTAMAAISWRYPKDMLLTHKVEPVKVGSPTPVPVTTGVGPKIEDLRFDYAITGDHPSWRPVRAFDDGQKVYIEFPPTLAQSEAPPLFVISSSGTADLTNYRVQGRFYVVDTLFGAAELRLGDKKQVVVRITRTDEARSSKRAGGRP